MSFSPTRGVVEKIDENFTHVRANVAMSLFLFNHKGEAPAPAELQKPGTLVEIYQGPDMLLHLRAAPAKLKLPERKAAPQAGSLGQSSGAQPGGDDSRTDNGPGGPAAAAQSKKLPGRRAV